MSLRKLSYPALLASVLLLSACSEEDAEKYCGTDLNTQINATIRAATALEASANAIATSVAAACTNIASDLGVTPQNPTDVESACQAADQAIADAITDGSLSITFVASPPVCSVDAQAQISCEAGCTVDASCNPGTIETRCDPGHFSVACDTECSADVAVVCVADAGASISCEGSCNGICNGSCEGACEGTCEGTTGTGGSCDGTCNGTCSGTCNGSCEGSCEYEASASGQCDVDASVRCRGGCEGSASLPRCEMVLMPPECELEAECQASCEAEASFKATCEPGRVHVVVDAGDATALAATLEENLPALLAVVDGYVLLWGNVEGFAEDVGDLYVALQDNLLCLGARLNTLLEAGNSALNAASSVSVTFQFSACVSASTNADGQTACEQN
jgi:hypothetical protein